MICKDRTMEKVLEGIRKAREAIKADAEVQKILMERRAKAVESAKLAEEAKVRKEKEDAERAIMEADMARRQAIRDKKKAEEEAKLKEKKEREEAVAKRRAEVARVKEEATRAMLLKLHEFSEAHPRPTERVVKNPRPKDRDVAEPRVAKNIKAEKAKVVKKSKKDQSSSGKE